MNFNDCLREGMLAETGDVDFNRATEILALIEHKCAFWKEVEAKAQKFPSLFIEGHYEIIKELIVAVLTLDGWKSANHGCLFQYVIEKRQDIELDFEYLSELRKLRNRIDYHGIKASADLWNQNKMRIQIVIDALKQDVKEKVK